MPDDLAQGTEGNDVQKTSTKIRCTRLFYAGDVHGSRVCWKKFVNAAAHYPADALVMGGDLTGKALVPIVREGDGSYGARVIGEERVARTAEELDQMQQAISTNGMYPLIVDEEEARSPG